MLREVQSVVANAGKVILDEENVLPNLFCGKVESGKILGKIKMYIYFHQRGQHSGWIRQLIAPRGVVGAELVLRVLAWYRGTAI